MKKISIIAPGSRKSETLAELKKVGVVHPEIVSADSPELAELLEKRERLEAAMNLLPEQTVPGGENGADIEQALVTAEEILEIGERLDALTEEKTALAGESERMAPWGEFDPEDLRMLRSRGIVIRLYELPSDLFEDTGKADEVFIVDRTKARVRFVTIQVPGRVPPANIENIPEIPLPETGLSGLSERIGRTTEELREVRSLLESRAVHKHSLKRALRILEGKIEFEQVRNSFGQEERLIYLTGYVPYDLVGKLEKAATEHRWGLLVQDPDSGDPVPTLTRNSKPIRIIRPVFDFLGTVPGYREYDISFFFLVFFTIFVSMIIGDAGYGTLLFTTVSILMLRGKSKGKRVHPAMILLFVLSVTTMIWGAVTGTWFGSEAIARIPPFKWFIIEPIYSFNDESSLLIRWICFILGTVQLSIAHLWNFFTQIRQKPRLRAFAQLGWLSMVLGLYFFVMNFVIDPVRFPIPSYSIYMVLGGFIAVLVFTNQQGNFLKGVLAGLAGFLPTFLSGVSAFADIISYIRLFAVGLAGVEIAKSFNAMASGLGNSTLGIVLGVVILLIGHSLNIVMSALSVVVHGVRLNMLEFSGHLGMEWSGVEYTPFTERLPEDTTAAV